MSEKQEVKKDTRMLKNESGRSMVEMLGVLAIMGMLSIGGIAGYRWAVDKNEANTILNEVRKRAVTISQQRILGHNINLDEHGTDGIMGHEITSTPDYNGNTGLFALTVKAVSKGVCDKVIAESMPFAIKTVIGESAGECADGDENAITFVFDNTLNSNIEIKNDEESNNSDACDTVTCAENQQCQNGECICLEESSCNGLCCDVGYVCATDKDMPYCSTATPCTSNANCNTPAEYCRSTSSSNSGYCAQLLLRQDLYGSADFMNWWSAKNFCSALGATPRRYSCSSFLYQDGRFGVCNYLPSPDGGIYWYSSSTILAASIYSKGSSSTRAMVVCK